MELKFFKVGNNYHLQEVSHIEEPLTPAVYTIQSDPVSKELYLEKTSDKFHIGHKIYGHSMKFVDRIIKTFGATTGNLGLLLNGVKGTGKTVDSKLVCNNLNLPVLVVPAPYPNLPDFLSKIPCDVTVFFDEFEKMYPANYNNNADILTVMEGVLTSEHRRVFILTTNSLYINDNLLERPGRLRYHVTYKDLTREVIEEVVDDLLVHKGLREDCIDFISTLKTITIDIIKKIIEEVNIHEERPQDFGHIFNIKKSSKKFDLFKVSEDGSQAIWFEDVTMVPIEPLKPNQRQALRIDGDWEASIVSIISPSLIVVDEEQQDPDQPALHVQVKIVERDSKHAAFAVF